MELKGHPWFLGCQFHPELKSRPLDCHPLFRGLDPRGGAAARGASAGKRSKVRELQIGFVSSRRGQRGRRDLSAAPQLVLIAGPCVIESCEIMPAPRRTARAISRARAGVPIVFKSSFDKANRTSHQLVSRARFGRRPARSWRGSSARPGLPCSPIFMSRRRRRRRPKSSICCRFPRCSRARPI